MATQDLINLDTPDDHPIQEWVENEWIGTGKKYPISGEVPAFIEAARSRALAVPSALSSYIPSQKVRTVRCLIVIRGLVFKAGWPVRTKIGCFRGLMAPSAQIWVFWRPDGQSEQILTFGTHDYGSPNILGEIFEISSVHKSQNFENFQKALPPIIRRPLELLDNKLPGQVDD